MRGAPGEKLTLECWLNGGPTAPGEARVAIDNAAGDFTQDVYERVRLLVSELVTNSVRHTGIGPGVEGQIVLRLSATPDRVRVEVSDPGGSGRPRMTPSPGADGGWGLLLVDQLSDRWGASQYRGTTVWFEIDRFGEPRLTGDVA
ncbi:MAG: ATP-binding protein [Actinomycetota bacterium]